jgi:hypothetical protein
MEGPINSAQIAILAAAFLSVFNHTRFRMAVFTKLKKWASVEFCC